MRTIQILVLGLLFAIALPAADALQQFRSAMSGNDAQAKQTAVNALAGSSLPDDEVLPLLISAVADRQASRYAIPALRSRTGLTPAPSRGSNTGYPAYPTADTPAAWGQWLQSRKQAQQEEQKLQEALDTAEEAKQAAEAAQQAVTAIDLDGDGKISEQEVAACAQADTDANGTLDADERAAAIAALAVAAASSEPGAPLPEHLKPTQSSKYGQLDRLFFTDGSILRCYVLTKRTDLEGNLTSVRIIHRDGGGEEIIDAAVVARIEEDIE